MQALIIFFSSLLYVGLKSFQQQSVTHEKYLWITPVSMAMAFCEFMIIGIVAQQNFWLFIPMGVGSGLGCMAAMHFHKKLRGH